MVAGEEAASRPGLSPGSHKSLPPSPSATMAAIRNGDLPPPPPSDGRPPSLIMSPIAMHGPRESPADHGPYSNYASVYAQNPDASFDFGAAGESKTGMNPGKQQPPQRHDFSLRATAEAYRTGGGPASRAGFVRPPGSPGPAVVREPKAMAARYRGPAAVDPIKAAYAVKQAAQAELRTDAPVYHPAGSSDLMHHGRVAPWLTEDKGAHTAMQSWAKADTKHRPGGVVSSWIFSFVWQSPRASTAAPRSQYEARHPSPPR